MNFIFYFYVTWHKITQSVHFLQWKPRRVFLNLSFQWNWINRY